MNKQNILTVLLLLFTPVFLVLFLLGDNYWMGVSLFNPYHIGALIVFILTAVISKSKSPLANNLIMISALICLLGSGGLGLANAGNFTAIMPRNTGFANAASIVCLVIIIGQEFIITYFRFMAVEKGLFIAVYKWGNLKVILQMVWICCALLLRVMDVFVGPWFQTYPSYLTDFFEPIIRLYYALLVAIILLTVVGGINYCVNIRRLLKER